MSAQGWEKISGTKKVNRFRPPEVAAALAALELARERLAAAADGAWRGFLAGFGQLYGPFRAAVQALGELDALQSLASLAVTPGSAIRLLG
jgi:DNA mismatch repair ATPase MutS